MTTQEINDFVHNNYRKTDGYVPNNGGKYGRYVITFKDLNTVDIVMSKQQRSQLWRTKISKDIHQVSDMGYMSPI